MSNWPIVLIHKNPLPLVAMTGEVIERTFVFNASDRAVARHSLRQHRSARNFKIFSESAGQER
jgi:hypothetical protein